MLDDLIGENGLLKQLTKALVERALLATWPHNSDTINIRLSSTAGNAHNGKSNKPSKASLASYLSKSYVTVMVALSHNNSD